MNTLSLAFTVNKKDVSDFSQRESPAKEMSP